MENVPAVPLRRPVAGLDLRAARARPRGHLPRHRPPQLRPGRDGDVRAVPRPGGYADIGLLAVWLAVAAGRRHRVRRRRRSSSGSIIRPIGHRSHVRRRGRRDRPVPRAQLAGAVRLEGHGARGVRVAVPERADDFVRIGGADVALRGHRRPRRAGRRRRPCCSSSFQKTKLGLAMRAVASNPESAPLVGIQTGQVLMVSWGLAAVVGAIGGGDGGVAATATSTPTMMFTSSSRPRPRRRSAASTACSARSSAASRSA